MFHLWVQYSLNLCLYFQQEKGPGNGAEYKRKEKEHDTLCDREVFVNFVSCHEYYIFLVGNQFILLFLIVGQNLIDTKSTKWENIYIGQCQYC